MTTRRVVSLLALLAGTGVAASAWAQQQPPPFGGPEDVGYADSLWRALAEAHLIGDDPIRTMPYEGTEPHGAILEYLEQALAVEGQVGLSIVKKNYRGEDLARDEVLRNPNEHLESITVMFRREEGYDSDNRNWFWAKYNPDGSLQAAPQGMQLAGAVVGCIECHSAVPGEDYVYSYDLARQQ